MILEDYIAYMNKSDFEGIASLFTENCRFNDGGARTIGVDDLIANGREAVRTAF